MYDAAQSGPSIMYLNISVLFVIGSERNLVSFVNGI